MNDNLAGLAFGFTLVCIAVRVLWARKSAESDSARVACEAVFLIFGFVGTLAMLYALRGTPWLAGLL